MKQSLIIIALIAVTKLCYSQSDKQLIERACLDYIEGFYEGDTIKLSRVFKQNTYKIGFWKNDSTGQYAFDGQMTYPQAIRYAKNVFDKKNFAKAGSPKKVEVYDIMRSIASAKVTAWWGVDYMLLSKQNGKWMIEQVLWEGPLEK